MKTHFLILLSLGFLFTMLLFGCRRIKENSLSVNCSTWDCIEKNKNKVAIVEGVFQKYSPWKTGKGAGHPFWEWEIVLSDSLAIPVDNTYMGIDYEKYVGKKVIIKGTIFYGIIIGCEEGQNATGFRIDPLIIEVKEKQVSVIG